MAGRVITSWHLKLTGAMRCTEVFVVCFTLLFCSLARSNNPLLMLLNHSHCMHLAYVEKHYNYCNHLTIIIVVLFNIG